MSSFKIPVQFSCSVVSDSVAPWIAARQASKAQASNFMAAVTFITAVICSDFLEPKKIKSVYLKKFISIYNFAALGLKLLHVGSLVAACCTF